MVTELMSILYISQVLVQLIVCDFLTNSTLQVFLEQVSVCDVAQVRLQVRQSFVKLAHENLVVGFTEVSVVICTELVVSVDHVADLAHHPLDSVHGAHTISISIHDSNWDL